MELGSQAHQASCQGPQNNCMDQETTVYVWCIFTHGSMLASKVLTLMPSSRAGVLQSEFVSPSFIWYVASGASALAREWGRV